MLDMGLTQPLAHHLHICSQDECIDMERCRREDSTREWKLHTNAHHTPTKSVAIYESSAGSYTSQSWPAE